MKKVKKCSICGGKGLIYSKWLDKNLVEPCPNCKKYYPDYAIDWEDQNKHPKS